MRKACDSTLLTLTLEQGIGVPYAGIATPCSK